MSRRGRSRLGDSEADISDSDVEFVELDASLSTASFSPHVSGGQSIGTNDGAVPDADGELPALDSAASNSGCHDAAATPAAMCAAAQGGATAGVGAAARAQACTSEQDRLLRELIGQLSKQGGSSRDKEEIDIDADVDYIRIEPHEAHEAHENAMAWSSSSVGSRFSFLIQRTPVDDESDMEDPADEPPAPAGAVGVPQDADDREESDQVLPLQDVALPQQQQQQSWRWWRLHGNVAAGAPVVAGMAVLPELANPVPTDEDGGDVSSSLRRQTMRLYKHDKNSRVNGALSVMATVALVLAVGIGIGHSIGSAREASLQQQIRDDQDSKLRELREDLLMCLRKQEDISQTITKLNEIEAILVDAEHWRNEYEELLKLKVQAEDGWRRERADLSVQLEQAKAELGSSQACQRDREFMSRQELRLDDVHAKLQVVLDHKEWQALDQQLAECKVDITARDEATRSLKTAIDSKNRAIVLLKEQLLDRELELVKVAASCSTVAAPPAAAAAATTRADASGAAENHQPGRSNLDEKGEGLAACQRQLLRSLERASHLESSLQHAQSKLAQQTPKPLSSKDPFEGRARSDDYSCSGGCRGSASIVNTMATAAEQSRAETRTSSSQTCNRAADGRDSEAELRRCARMVLAARETQPRMTSTWADEVSPGQLALDRSLRLYAAATSATDSRSSRPKQAGHGGSGGDDADEGDQGGDALQRLFLGTRIAVEGLLGVANRSLHVLANTSATLLHDAGRSAADVNRKWNVSEKVSAAAAGVKAGMLDVAKHVANALKTAAVKAKEAAEAARSAGAAAETVAQGKHDGSTGRSADAAAPSGAAEKAAEEQKPPAVNVSLFWADFKELRQLVSNYTERSHLTGEAERTYGAVAAFLRRYNVSEAELPGGTEWKAWCSCQLAWWTKRLRSLEGVVDCSDRLADWQVDATKMEERSAAPAATVPPVDTKAGDTAKHGEDLIAPQWVFERAAEREFLRETPDDWYWRRVKDMYSKMYKLFSDARPQK